MTSDFIFDREQERSTLAERLSKRRPLLVYGPAGVGKTLLVTSLLRGLPEFIYSPDSSTIHTVYRAVASELWKRRAPRIVKSFGSEGLDAVRHKSGSNLKGVTVDALREGKYCLVLDHIHRPPHAYAAAIRELIGSAETPVMTIARSAHMEDTGFLQPIYDDRKDRFEIKNFDDATAERFAKSVIEQLGLYAENLREFLDRVLDYSRGNPGSIIAMLKLGSEPKYRSHERIKIAPLYIDFRLQFDPAVSR
jgi:AAA+ ATPase superfamily predicted ATPase